MLFKFLCILGICSGFTRFASCFLLSGKSDVSEEWSQWTIINTHGDTCLRLRTRHCAKTSVNCTDKEFSAVCPVAPHWEEWSALQCSVQNGATCIIARTRNCSVPTLKDCQSNEKSREIQVWGDMKTCPCREGVILTTNQGTGQWEDWSGWQCQKNAGSCYIFRTRQCSVPDRKNCPPSGSSQLKLWQGSTCPCGTGNMKTTTESQLPTTTGVSRHANTDSNTVFTTASVRNPLNTTTSVPHWLEWSAWQCYNVDFGCIQSRWRRCSNSQYGCVGDHYELASCHQAGCTGHLTTDSSIGQVSSTDNSNKYPSWSGWGPWECHNELITCVMYRHRNCSDGYEVDCEKIGSKSYEMSQCDDSCKNSLVKATTTLLPDASMTSFPILRTSTQAPSFISVVTKTSFASFDQSSVVIPFTKSSVTTTSPITDIPIYWLEWTGWDCQGTPVWCFMKNTRNCSTYNPGDCEDKLGGSHYEVHTCRTEICPAHWLEWGEWRCKMGNNGSCNMTRTRECSTGSTEACGLISSMSLPCERQVCPDKFELHQSGRCRGFNDTSCTDVPTCSIITDMHQLICQFKDTASKDCPKACGCCEEEAHWSEWSDWECQRLANYTCRMIRTRKCSTNDTNDCKGMSEVKAACSHSICQALPTHVSTILPNTIGSISTLTTELNGVGTKCKMFDSRNMKCEDALGCDDFKSYLDVVCSEQGLSARCPVSCGCCASSLRLSTIQPTSDGSTSTLTTAFSTHVSTNPPTTIGSISTLTKAKRSAQWSEWFYGKCSASCGNGITNRLRHCNTGRDVDCAGKPFETVPCTASDCPVDGVWSEWTRWSTCTKTCGDGMHTRIRKCDNPATQHGGLQCNGVHNETTACKYMECPHWLAFENITSCSVTCGTGIVQLKRYCSTGNQSDCTGNAHIEMPCNLQNCL